MFTKLNAARDAAVRYLKKISDARESHRRSNDRASNSVEGRILPNLGVRKDGCFVEDSAGTSKSKVL